MSKEGEFNSQNVHTEIRIRIWKWDEGVYYIMYFLAPLFIQTAAAENRQKSEKSSHGTWSMKRLFYILHVGICEIFLLFCKKNR